MSLNKWRWLFIAMLFLTGCSGWKTDGGQYDMEQMNRLVENLGAAGFTGRFTLEVNPKVEFYLKEAVGAEGPILLRVSGEMNPWMSTDQSVEEEE